MADADREDEGAAPLDEEAVWAALVAGFDAEYEPGAVPAWPEAENVTADKEREPAAEPQKDEAPDDPAPPSPAAPAGPPTRSIVIHPVIRGPRDYGVEEDEDDGHFVPPEPPPLPEADLTTKFGWIAVLGGPLLLFTFVLLQLDLAWWVLLVGAGGFVGGFATLVARMRTDEDEDDDPHGGAVV